MPHQACEGGGDGGADLNEAKKERRRRRQKMWDGDEERKEVLLRRVGGVRVSVGGREEAVWEECFDLVAGGPRPLAAGLGELHGRTTTTTSFRRPRVRGLKASPRRGEQHTAVRTTPPHRNFGKPQQCAESTQFYLGWTWGAETFGSRGNKATPRRPPSPTVDYNTTSSRIKLLTMSTPA
ncbi:uncharacterized protein EI97DRAFT_440033 [Westerdykella ornata]|uniref:Uncharacterized protein n=1 Tax=Westerdykella ornata TaxID=318751 RepID=A0A6A6JVG3_WESOR|nr:uncharacterized protein EI97DRAFT_440033 [Westerdykella ornata]KAF2279736.1 hypothetical protein EI97DRAFT_440033 [Westerdykella ornata]